MYILKEEMETVRGLPYPQAVWGQGYQKSPPTHWLQLQKLSYSQASLHYWLASIKGYVFSELD